MTEKKVDLSKNVFNKIQYSQTIDTSFRELGVTSIAEDLQQQTSVEQFFALYNSLFYDIPPNGEVNSHEYLVQQSGEYINFDQNLEEIEALQNEITQLRKDLLASQIENIELKSGRKVNIDVENLGANIDEITQEVNRIKETIELPTITEATETQEQNTFTILSDSGV